MRCPRRAARFAAVAVVALLAVVLVPQALADATYVVNSTADTGSGCPSSACTLRDAVTAANSDDVPSTITFAQDAGQLTITVNGSAPAVTAPVTIDGGIAPFNVGVTLRSGGALQGLELQSGSDGSVIRGLAFAGFQNEGPGAAGLLVESNGNTIAGDYFGVSADGAASGNANDNGLIVSGSNNTIGGSAPADQNVIVNNSNGVVVQAPVPSLPPAGNVIQGNLIGLLSDETTPAGNTTGIQVLGATGTVIGVNANPSQLDVVAAQPERANVIAASSGDGILIGAGATGTIVTGNFVGVDRSGGATGAKGNGIHLSDASSNQIGPGNTVAGNSGDGVIVDGSSISDRIVANSIHDNAGQGISLGSGANDDLPAPTITSVTSGTVTGTVSGPTGPTTIWIEFFRNPSCANTANGAGQTYLTFVPVDIPSDQTRLYVERTGGRAQQRRRPDGDVNELRAPATLRRSRIARPLRAARRAPARSPAAFR